MTTRAPARAFTLREVLQSGAWLSILFWGASFPVTRKAIEAFHPYAMVAARFALGSALLYALLALRREPLWPRREDRAHCALLGAILGAHIAAQGFALFHTTAVHSGWIIGFCPVAIALGSQLFLGQRLRALSWAGVAVASSGVLLVTLAQPAHFEHAGWGDLLVLGTTFSWAAYTLLSAGVVRRNGALRTSAFAMGVASLVCAGAALLSGRLWTGDAGPLHWTSLAFLGVCCSAGAFALWNSAIDRFGTAKLGGLIYFQPFVTLGLSLVLLDEPLTWNAWVGGPLVVLGVWLLARGTPNRPATALESET